MDQELEDTVTGVIADVQTLNAGQRRHLSIHEYQSVQLLNSVCLALIKAVKQVGPLAYSNLLDAGRGSVANKWAAGMSYLGAGEAGVDI